MPELLTRESADEGGPPDGSATASDTATIPAIDKATMNAASLGVALLNITRLPSLRVAPEPRIAPAEPGNARAPRTRAAHTTVRAVDTFKASFRKRQGAQLESVTLPPEET